MCASNGERRCARREQGAPSALQERIVTLCCRVGLGAAGEGATAWEGAPQLLCAEGTVHWGAWRALVVPVAIELQEALHSSEDITTPFRNLSFHLVP